MRGGNEKMEVKEMLTLTINLLNQAKYQALLRS